MELSTPLPQANDAVSKVKLALGAASLFLFIVGIKRTFEPGEADRAGSGQGPGAEPRSAARPERDSPPAS